MTTTNKKSKELLYQHKTESIESRTKKTLPNEQLKITTAQFEKQETKKFNKDHKINSKIKIKKCNQQLNGVIFGTGPTQIKLKAAPINSSQRVIDSRTKFMI